jgi:TetR/AcrR family transcriptional repressor of mexCD-oprJ operon
MARPSSSPRRAPRSDGLRNKEAILDAALTCFAQDPTATIGAIAEHAGVGRVTLYGHFKTRAELVNSLLERVISHADTALDGLELDSDPREDLRRLVTATWQLVNQCRAVLHAAQQELAPEDIRARHEPHLRRIEALLARGQRAGVFRRDLPKSWLVATCYSLMHAAADECTAGRLAPAKAGNVIAETLLSALARPAS